MISGWPGIRGVSAESPKTSAALVREAFGKSVEEFELTRQNCLTSPAFLENYELADLLGHGVRLSG